MAFIDKIVKQERTGASVAGVNVDTSIGNMINPKNVMGIPIKAIGNIQTYEIEVLDTIEAFAKDVEKARIENAKIKLGLELENARLDLEEKWATVHDRYTNDESWNAYLEDKKKLLSEQTKIISSMKYMSMDEKKLTLKRNNIAYREDYARNLAKRTDAWVKIQADDAQANLEQLVTLSGNLGIYDREKAKEYYKTMINQIDVLKKIGGLSNEEAIVAFGNYTSKAEAMRQQNYIEKEIMNEDLTFEQRETKLNNLKKIMEDEPFMRAYTKEVASLLPSDNQKEAEDYLYAKLSDENTKVVNRMSNEFKRVKRERQEAERARIRAEKQIQSLIAKNQKLDESLRSEKYSDVRKAFKKRYGRDMTDEDIVNGTVVFDWASAGDLDNFDKVEIFDKDEINNLKRNINAQISNERLTEEQAKNLVKVHAEELMKDDNSPEKQLKIYAYIKQYADTENPIPYAYGDKYPELYQAERISKISRNKENNIKIKKPEKGWIFNDDGYSEWEDLKKEFSSDPAYADAQLTNYLTALMKDDGLKAEDMKKESTRNAYLKKLSTDEGKRLINASKILKSGKTAQSKKTNTASTKKNKMGGYLR